MSPLIVLPAGFLLDLMFGDPRWMPHCVVVIGKLIALMERICRRLFPKTARGELVGGTVLTICVVLAAFVAAHAVIAMAAKAHPLAGTAVQIFICYQALATKCLADAGKQVYGKLALGDLDGARRAVAGIVGRDTAALDADAVTRATVETVAENTSDGVVAPMFYFALGGAPLALAYKAINTMDSMLGYKNQRYLHFGRASARLDDVANYVPARLTALLMIAAAAPCGLDWRRAWRTIRRDGRNHTSPNAGYPEAACAGALGVRLGGDSAYGGVVVRKPSIGDATRDIEPDDIRRANRILYAAACLCFILCYGGFLIARHVTDGMTAWN